MVQMQESHELPAETCLQLAPSLQAAQLLSMGQNGFVPVPETTLQEQSDYFEAREQPQQQSQPALEEHL